MTEGNFVDYVKINVASGKGGKGSGRADDSNREIIENRINEYYTKTAILKTYYQRKNCYYGVDGVGSIEEITSRIVDAMSKL